MSLVFTRINKYIVLITISVPLLISYLFWVIHTISRIDSLYLENVYVNKIYKSVKTFLEHIYIIFITNIHRLRDKS